MTITLLQGDCRDILPTLPPASVQCVVTSPPYWGLRDYGTAQWGGGDPECDHAYDRSMNGRASTQGKGTTTQTKASIYREMCGKCGAVRVDRQLGLDQTPDDYIQNMVGVFREVKRVLRDDGTLWLNIGDSYAGSWGAQSRGDDYPGTLQGGSMLSARQIAAHPKTALTGSLKRTPGLKNKDLVGIPWMLAFALRADGWYLRCDIVWHKPNPMPESVTDRPTRAHEYLFLLSKSERYYYDAIAIAEQVKQSSLDRISQATFDQQTGGLKDYANGTNPARSMRKALENFAANGSGTRNRRSVWTISTTPYKDAHFATFPEALVEPCILAGSGSRACEVCGAAWVRMVEQEKSDWQTRRAAGRTSGSPITGHNASHGVGTNHTLGGRVAITTGWQQACSCSSEGTTRSIVLDPFAGSGTTLRVAERFGRDSIGIELNGDYIKLQEKRTDGVQKLMVELL